MFFFFSSRRRHTRLQGDWSSDVCSSDLEEAAPPRRLLAHDLLHEADTSRVLACEHVSQLFDTHLAALLGVEREPARALLRSEERRVGKECRARWVRCEQETED